MSDSYERSYYEIALTNSQVLSALAVLLLCLLGAFVGGMWVARGNPTAPAVEAEPAAGGSTEEASAGQAAELDFFGETAEAPVERPRQAPRQTVTPVQVAESREREPSPSASRPQPERRETAARPEPEAAQAEVGTADDNANSGEGEDRQLGSLFVIQVLSSGDQSQAAKTMARLQESGYRAFISPTEVEGRRMYRVRVGPYADREQATSAEEKIKRQFRLDTWITSSA